MKTLCYASLMLLFAATVQAEELLQSVTLAPAAASASMQLDEGALRVSAVPGQAQQVLVELPGPGISSAVYALKGMIRYDAVEGEGYLQLDNHFGDQGTYFTKSLADSGPLGKISGTSDWRAFTLPFFARSGSGADATVLTPEKLTLSLYLPGAGTVFIRDLGLFQYAEGEDPLADAGQWMSARTGTLIGAIGGSLVGLWGALIGFLTARGRARSFVLGSANLLIVLGIVSLGAGIVGYLVGQPYAVWYPLALLGAILVLVLGGLRRSLPKRYEAIELQKIKAMDA